MLVSGVVQTSPDKLRSSYSVISKERIANIRFDNNLSDFFINSSASHSAARLAARCACKKRQIPFAVQHGVGILRRDLLHLDHFIFKFDLQTVFSFSALSKIP